MDIGSTLAVAEVVLLHTGETSSRKIPCCKGMGLADVIMCQIPAIIYANRHVVYYQFHS